MPYTLAMFLLWGLLMALVGGVIGWMLGRVRSRSRPPRTRRHHDRADGPPS